jgi:uncharacterized protein (DUF1800 family)
MCRRNAFGSFRGLLKEIAYSPLMAYWLTFMDNQGFHISGMYPDENFAREFMELFSIGLFKLNSDGTHQRDDVGASLPSYDNHDVMAFARLWTGFSK